MSTERIGTLMPTPSVSVPQMTRSRPRCASVSTSRRYRGSMPAWCTPMPARTSRERVLPNAVLNRNPPIASAISSRCSRVTTRIDDSACARSIAAAWEKCTMYTGACRVSSSSSTVSCTGVFAYEKCSGTGRSTPVTCAVSRPVRRVRSAAMSVTSPSVADMRMNWARDRVMSGTCHAHPRSVSP